MVYHAMHERTVWRYTLNLWKNPKLLPNMAVATPVQSPLSGLQLPWK